jgi:transposase
VDLRGSFDRLCHLTAEQLQRDPGSGALYIFLNRRKNRLKALWWDKNGYTILYKRLSKGTFPLPAVDSDASSVEITAEQFAHLLAGLPISVQPPPTLH